MTISLEDFERAQKRLDAFSTAVKERNKIVAKRNDVASLHIAMRASSTGGLGEFDLYNSRIVMNVLDCVLVEIEKEMERLRKEIEAFGVEPPPDEPQPPVGPRRSYEGDSARLRAAEAKRPIEVKKR